MYMNESNFYVNHPSLRGKEDDIYEGVREDKGNKKSIRVGPDHDEAWNYALVDFNRRPLTKEEFGEVGLRNGKNKTEK